MGACRGLQTADCTLPMTDSHCDLVAKSLSTWNLVVVRAYVKGLCPGPLVHAMLHAG